MKPDDVQIPEDALSEKFLAATGPGGQNVNKVATACQLRVDVFKLGLAPHVYAKLKLLAGSKMTSGGELVITARRYRSQEGNREDARRRLAEMLAEAHVVQAKRTATRPSRAAKARRVDSKKPRHRKAGSRQGENRLMYDFKIDAADTTAMYDDLANALRRRSPAIPMRSPTWPMRRR